MNRISKQIFMKKNQVILFLLVAVMLVIPQLIFAQVGPGGDPGDVPIDGGLSLLVAAGIGYGAKKVHEARKKKNLQNVVEEQGDKG